MTPYRDRLIRLSDKPGQPPDRCAHGNGANVDPEGTRRQPAWLGLAVGDGVRAGPAVAHGPGGTAGGWPRHPPTGAMEVLSLPDPTSEMGEFGSLVPPEHVTNRIGQTDKEFVSLIRRQLRQRQFHGVDRLEDPYARLLEKAGPQNDRHDNGPPLLGVS